MKLRNSALCVVTAMAVMAQSFPASAHNHHEWRGGGGHDGFWPIAGLVAVGGALAVGAVELATAPIRAVGEAAQEGAPPPNYGYNQAPPAYNQAPPQYYAQAPAYYPPQAYAPPPQAYYAPQPMYAPPVYYGRGYYYR